MDDSGVPYLDEIGTGVRTVQPVRKNGQSPLEEIRNTLRAEAGDSMFFFKGDNTATFLPADHRSSSPHDTAQATFGDAASVWTESGTLTVS